MSGNSATIHRHTFVVLNYSSALTHSCEWTIKIADQYHRYRLKILLQIVVINSNEINAEITDSHEPRIIDFRMNIGSLTVRNLENLKAFPREYVIRCLYMFTSSRRLFSADDYSWNGALWRKPWCFMCVHRELDCLFKTIDSRWFHRFIHVRFPEMYCESSKYWNLTQTKDIMSP